MNLRSLGILVVVFGLGFLAVNLLAPRSQTASNLPQETPSEGGIKTEGDLRIIDWRLLQKFDLTTRRRSDELLEVDGKRVKIAGFMVPLEDYQREVSEFLLVPQPMMCIHVPAPAANQMIYVKLKKGGINPMAYTPIWVEGDFEIVDTESPYGNTAFELKAEAIKPFSKLQKVE